MLKARVVYFPKHGFGHIAVLIINPETKEEIYYDFGGSHDLAVDRSAGHYGEPVFIDFPEINTNWNEFLSKMENSCYNARRGRGFPEEYSYKLLKNNCANSVEQILHMAGYIEKKPRLSFARLPYSVAMLAAKVARINRETFRRQIIQAIRAQDTGADRIGIINRLINTSSERLNNEAAVARSANYKTGERALLANINFDGSRAAIKRILEASELVSRATAAELRQCLSVLPQGEYIKLAIARLDVTAENLTRRGFPTASDCARNLADSLFAKVDALEKNIIDYQAFKKGTHALIKNARPTLAQHRGCKRILMNIALGIAGLGVFYLLAIAANKKLRGHYLFFNDTKSVSLVRGIENEIQNRAEKNKLTSRINIH